MSGWICDACNPALGFSSPDRLERHRRTEHGLDVGRLAHAIHFYRGADIPPCGLEWWACQKRPQNENNCVARAERIAVAYRVPA